MSRTLSQQEKADIRSLERMGFSQVVLAALFDVSDSTITRAVAAPPPDSAQLSAAREALEEIQAERYRVSPRFAGFDGEKAKLVADVFGCAPDGGDAWDDAYGYPRDGMGVTAPDGSTLGPGSSLPDYD